MKLPIHFTVALLFAFQSALYAQAPSAPKLYAHKGVVDSVLQTKAYTYLKVRERIGEKDSLQWMALPAFEAKVGDIYYFESGMEMGEFHSRELDRTFQQIMFLGNLSTSAEYSEKTLVPKPVLDTVPQNATPAVVHTVVVKEVIQAGGYSYLRVKEGDKEEWLAVVRIPAVVGQAYTFDDAAPMKNFTSAELKRTFPEILFIAKLKLSNNAALPESTTKRPGKIKLVQVADLYKDKESYAGKTVRITGKVTKFNSDILGKNWIHMDDGTAFHGKSDLTVTTEQMLKVGDLVTLEGKISQNKDFGSGYFFEVIMENAKTHTK